MSDEGTRADDRIDGLLQRVEALEAQVRMLVGVIEEKARIDAMLREETGDEGLPEQTDRESAVVAAGATLRVMFAALPPEKRAQALAEATPAEVCAEFAPLVPASLRASVERVGSYARDHALTWADPRRRVSPVGRVLRRTRRVPRRRRRQPPPQRRARVPL